MRSCFNEAPALRRGKWRRGVWIRRLWRGFNEAPALRRGKCRTNPVAGRFDTAASMRPRHYAGESGRFNPFPIIHFPASMRPRHYAGESWAVACTLLGVAAALQ